MTDACDPADAIVVGADQSVAVTGTDCISITPSRPDWDPTAITFASAGSSGGITWPIAFHATQTCSGLDEEAELDSEWSTPVALPTSESCPLYIQLLGTAEDAFSVRWYPQP